MKLVFIQDYIGYQFGIMYISSVLKKHNHYCEVFVEGLEDDLITAVCEAKPSIIGFSSMTGTQRWLKNTISRLKNRLNVPIVVGGPHPTYFPETINEEGIDITCIGEGERPMLELANRFDKGEDYSDIPGLYVKKNGKVVRNVVAPIQEDLDQLPLADRSIYLKYPFFQELSEVTVCTSRGCPWKCNFCHNASRQELYAGDKFVRLRSVKSIIDELDIVTKELKKVTSVTIVDDIIGINRKWLNDFCDEYREKIRLPWYASIRADLIAESTVKKLKESNCFCLSLGVESGNGFLRQSVLGKNIGNDTMVRAGRLIKEAGIKLRTSNMYFLPGETIDNAFETIQINKAMGVDYPWVYAFQPYPNTPLYDYAVKNGFLDKNFSFNDIDPLGLVKSPIKLKDTSKILVLHRLFYYAVKIPGFEYLLKFLVYVPNNFLFDFLHRMSLLFTYAGYHQISIFKALTVTLQARRQLKANVE